MNKNAVVCDTSLLLYLGRIHKAEFLTSLYEQVYVPKQVISELDAGRLLRQDTIDPRQISGIRIISVSQKEIDALPPKQLGIGEKSVIAYTLNHKECLAGIDDRIARVFEEQLGIKVIGIIGILLKAKNKGFVSQINPLLKAVRLQGFHIAENLYREALRLADEIV